jgi:hypothetical protein
MVTIGSERKVMATPVVVAVAEADIVIVYGPAPVIDDIRVPEGIPVPEISWSTAKPLLVGTFVIDVEPAVMFPVVIRTVELGVTELTVVPVVTPVP